MAVFRAVGMKSAPGKESEFDNMFGGSMNSNLEGTEGLLFMANCLSGSGQMSGASIFASSAHCEAWKQNTRAAMMEKFKGIMGGPPTYMVEGELQKQWSNGQKITSGMALRNVGFKCKPGQEGAFQQMASSIYDQPPPAGLVFRAYMMSDSRTMNSCSVFEDMNSLEAYTAEVRAKYASQMQAMMEGPVYDEKGVIKTGVGPKGDGGDACCGGCVVQ